MTKAKILTLGLAALCLTGCGQTDINMPVSSEESSTPAETSSSVESSSSSSSSTPMSDSSESIGSIENSSSFEDLSSEDISEPQLVLTYDSITGDGNSYANYDGEHHIDNFTVTTSNVMPANSAYTYDQDVLQFKAQTGTLSVNGCFSTITLVALSTYDYASNFTFSCGENSIVPESATLTEDTEWTYKDTYAVKKYTITVTFDTTIASTYTIAKTSTTKGAGYVTSISLY